MLPSSGRVPRVDRPVAYDAKQPGSRVRRKISLAGELQKCFLNDILGVIAPLPRIKFEGGRVLVEKLCEQVVVHEFIVSTFPFPLPLNDVRRKGPSHLSWNPGPTPKTTDFPILRVRSPAAGCRQIG